MGAAGNMRMVFVDTEYCPVDGELPRSICIVFATRDGSVEKRWLWNGDLVEPIRWHPDDVMVCYSATAELATLTALGWPRPPRVLDLYVEFRNATNGILHEGGSGLLTALARHKQPARDPERKAELQAMCGRGIDSEIIANRDAIVEYCTDDVTCMFGLVDAMLPGINLPAALARGEYMCSVAKMEAAGVPIDSERYRLIAGHRNEIRKHIAYVNNYWHPVWNGATFSEDKFERWLQRRNLDKTWPRTATGRISLEEQTFDDMLYCHPDLEYIAEIRSTIIRIQSFDLKIGSDGRARSSLGPFRTVTSRNQPHRNAEFIFAAPRWMRSIVRAEPGMALANLDWSQQEFGIVAALSRDRAMMDAYRSVDADPYMAFARSIGAVPRGATAKSHPVERERYKRCVLSVQYCQGAHGLARRLGCIVADARALLRDHRQAFPSYWAWLDRISTTAAGRGKINSVFGWHLRTDFTTNPRTVRNFGGQANGAEMMRLACVLGHEAGIKILAPVHDSLLIEAPAGDIKAAVKAMTAAMAQASREVLGGFELRADVHVYTGRFDDPKGGKATWEMVSRLLGVSP